MEKLIGREREREGVVIGIEARAGLEVGLAGAAMEGFCGLMRVWAKRKLYLSRRMQCGSDGQLCWGGVQRWCQGVRHRARADVARDGGADRNQKRMDWELKADLSG